MKITKAVIPAAGLGTRLFPMTNTQPKEMLLIGDKPTIQYIIEEAKASGIEEVLIITGRYERVIKEHFDELYKSRAKLLKSGKEASYLKTEQLSNLPNISYVQQPEPLQGLGHAILCAKEFVGHQPFAVLLGDDVVYTDGTPCLKQISDVYEKCGTNVLGVQKVSHEDVSKYGVIGGERCGERLYRVRTLVEKPAKAAAPSSIAILGRYILNPSIFEFLKTTKPGVDGEIQLTDALCKMVTQENMYAYDFIGRRYDIGTKKGFLEAIVEYALRQDELDEFKKFLIDTTNKLIKT
ncbi:UTP--glucose-1-phosphate uridylyltransferase [Candidatus Bathycorpusculum sp.]|uniref:UTP--glucose-1-phosphate uridylyltransferase n=1 Tax=Candidatus Bathycorpusculum sp. TaxID=2994959 RepID=UPI0031CC4DEC